MALAAILILSLVPPALADGSTFSDVSPNHWAYAYIEQAAAAGAVNGVGNGRFDPEGTVTWAQFCTIIVRAYYPDEVGPAAAGIPCMVLAGGDHAWSFAYIDGVWYAVDTSVTAKYNYPGADSICSLADWDLRPTDSGIYKSSHTDTVKVAMAMAEAAGW